MNPTLNISPLRKALALLLVAVLAVVVVLSACQPAPSALAPQDFETQWHDLIGQRNYTAAQKLIDQREKQNPGDAEVSIARANLYFRQATSAAAGFSGSGRGAGSAGDSAKFDTLLVHRALDELSQGIARHPERFDMRLGLAYLFQQVGLRVPQAQLIRETVAYTKAHPDSLRWTYGDPLPNVAEIYVPQMLHDYVRYYVDRAAPGDDQAVFALGQTIMEAYPHSPYVPNDIAYWFGQQGDWANSLKYLQAAERADSTDALVLYNLGWANEQLKRKAPATHYYRRALVVSTAGGKTDISQSAQQRLAAMGQ